MYLAVAVFFFPLVVSQICCLNPRGALEELGTVVAETANAPTAIASGALADQAAGEPTTGTAASPLVSTATRENSTPAVPETQPTELGTAQGTDARPQTTLSPLSPAEGPDLNETEQAVPNQTEEPAVPDAEETDVGSGEATATTGTAVNKPTATPALTPSPAVTRTPPPADCKNDSIFVTDVTIPDNTQIAAGSTFTKIWRLRNTGSCPWGPDYEFIFVHGHQMGAPPGIPVDRDVNPQEPWDAAVTFVAPEEPGTYLSRWQLRAPDGDTFGKQPYMQIKVVPASAQPTEAPLTPSPTPEPTEADEAGTTVPAELKDTLQFPAGAAETAGDSVADLSALCLEPAAMETIEPLALLGPLSGSALDGAVQTGDEGLVCVYGIPHTDEFAVDLFRPDGQLAGSAVFRIQEGGADEGYTYQAYPELARAPIAVDASLSNEPIVGTALKVDALEVTAISLWLPAGMPSGRWRGQIRWPGEPIESMLQVGARSRPVVSALPVGAGPGPEGIDPFRPYRPGSYAYASGGDVRLQGAGFPPNSQFALGLYLLSSDGQAERVHGQTVKSDGAGGFSLVVSLAGYQPGTYLVVPMPGADGHSDATSFFMVSGG
jgi:hypothetical protein